MLILLMLNHRNYWSHYRTILHEIKIKWFRSWSSFCWATANKTKFNTVLNTRKFIIINYYEFFVFIINVEHLKFFNKTIICFMISSLINITSLLCLLTCKQNEWFQWNIIDRINIMFTKYKTTPLKYTKKLKM